MPSGRAAEVDAACDDAGRCREHRADELIERAAAFAASRKGSAGPPGETSGDLLRYFYRHVAAEDIARAHRDRPVRRRDEPVQARDDRPQGTANIRVVHPDRRRARLVRRRAHRRRGGHRRHAVPRRLGDDGAQRAEPRGAHGRAPADPRAPRHHRRSSQEVFTGDDRRSTGRDLRARRLPRVVDARRDRPGVERRASARRSSGRWPRCCTTSARPSRTGRRCTRRRWTIIETSRATRRRCPPRRSPRAQALLRWLADDHFTFLGYREYRLEDRDDGDGRRRCCARCPAPASASCAPTRTCPRRSASCRPWSRAQGPREDAAGAGQGQLQGDRAPAGLPRLHRRQDVRRERRGRRRAPLPRAVLLGGLHRVADPDPGDPGQGQAGASTGPASRR